MSNVIKTLSDRLAFSSVTPSITDTDVSAFLTATGITDIVQQMAVNELVLDLKRFSLWTRFVALYPFIGGTASTHKYNLKDPRDLDAAFRLVFSAGWTHADTGAKPSAANANTFIIPSSSLLQNDVHLSLYSRTNIVGSSQIEMGSTGPAGSLHFLTIQTRYANNLFYGDVNQTVEDGGPVKNSLGLFITTRTASNAKRQTVNGNTVLTSSTVSTGLNNNAVYIGCINNNGSAAYNSTKEFAFASVGYGLTSSDCTNLYTCVQKYQGSLNREVYG